MLRLKLRSTRSRYSFRYSDVVEILGGRAKPLRRLEAPNGFEPLHKGFADLSLSHLGTAPHYYKLVLRSYARQGLLARPRRSEWTTKPHRVRMSTTLYRHMCPAIHPDDSLAQGLSTQVRRTSQGSTSFP